MKEHLLGRSLSLAVAQIALCVLRSLAAGDGPPNAACCVKGAAIREKPSATAKLARRADWMEMFWYEERSSRESRGETWVKVSQKDNRSGRPKPLGWMPLSSLLTTDKALRRKGVHRKVLVSVGRDKDGNTRPADLYYEPRQGAPSRGKLLKFTHFFVFALRKDAAGKTFYLIGRRCSLPYGVWNDGIEGWAVEGEVIPWDTREACEWDKKTLIEGKRGPGSIFAELDDVRMYLGGRGDPKIVDTEDDCEKPGCTHTGDCRSLGYGDWRYPLRKQLFVDSGGGDHEVWFVCFPSVQSDAVRKWQEATAHNVLEIYIVFDATGSMSGRENAVSELADEIVEEARKVWDRIDHKLKKPEIRLSISMFRDYEKKKGDPSSFDWLPLAPRKTGELREFIKAHPAEGGADNPALLNGIARTFEDNRANMSKYALRSMFLIGDMGNLAAARRSRRSYTDPKGHTTAKVAALLDEFDCDLYGLHIAASLIDDPDYATFKEDIEQIGRERKKPVLETRYMPIQRSDVESIKKSMRSKIISLLEERLKGMKLGDDMGVGVNKDPGLQQRAIEGGPLGAEDARTGLRALRRLCEQLGIDPRELAEVQEFREGYVLAWETAGGKRRRFARPVVLLSRGDLDDLARLFRSLATKRPTRAVMVDAWLSTIEEMIGEEIPRGEGVRDRQVLAKYVEAWFGVPVKSRILQYPLSAVMQMSSAEIARELSSLERTAILLGAVYEEVELKNLHRERGQWVYDKGGPKKYFFGGYANEHLWLPCDLLP